MIPSEEETDENLEWDVDMEIQLFYAMANNKPVGINKHFIVASIWEKLSNSTTKEISTQDIWKHLDTLYDLQMLDDTESIPFPNDDVPFTLPDNDFGALLKEKSKEVAKVEESDGYIPEAVPFSPSQDLMSETQGYRGKSSKIIVPRSPSPKSSTPRSSSRGTSSKDGTPKATSIRKDSTSGLQAIKTRKESGSSYASTDTPSIKSEKDYDRRRDSRDSNASGPRESSTSRKSIIQKDKSIKPRVSSTTAWDSPAEDDAGTRRGRRRANTSTPPATIPPKRRRT